MKKMICVLLMLVFLTGSALAASSVTYKGGAEEFVFLPGSAESESDLFENFKGVLPGDELTQKITVKNSTGDKVRIYLRAETQGMKDRDFLSQLKMRVECRDAEIFEAAPSQTAQLTENTLLGTFKSEGSTELTVTLTVPADMGNKYMNRTGVVPWTFLVEEIEGTSSGTPDTGDWFQTGVWISVAAVLAMAILLLIVLRRRREEET